MLEYTREHAPFQWAATQNNLGVALATLGRRENVTAHLEEAVTAYRAALEEWRRERVPLQWATVQNNLGNALWTLGEREAETARLKEALVAHLAALEERPRERAPVQWAQSNYNISQVLEALAQRRGDRQMMAQAIAKMRDVAEVLRAGAVSNRLAVAEANVARMEVKLAEMNQP